MKKEKKFNKCYKKIYFFNFIKMFQFVCLILLIVIIINKKLLKQKNKTKIFQKNPNILFKNK